jgi:hypothetical protein
MNKTRTLLLMTLALVTFSGCSSKNTSRQEFNNAPKWVKVPRVKGYITGLGIAPPNQGDDIALQRNEAMAVARDDISRQIETKVGSFTDKFAESTGTKDKRSFARDVKTKIRSITKTKLRGARTQKSWMSESGKLYLLMTLETKEVLNMIKQSSSNLNDKDIKFQRFLSEKNQKELEKELENYEK